MERYKVLTYNLCSAIVEGLAQIKYKENAWVSAPRWLAERGYHPLVFKTFEQCKSFVENNDFESGYQIWRCKVRRPAMLKKVCNVAYLGDGQFLKVEGGWPPGTEMWREIKLITRVK